MFNVAALSAPVGAVAPALLADRLGVDVTDPNLSGLILAATGAVAGYVRRAITPTQYRATFYEWPVFGARGPFVSGSPARVPNFIELPKSGGLTSITSIMVDGVALTVGDYELQQGNPARVVMTPAEPVEVVYQTSADGTPPEVAEAVLMLAAYLYEHRGTCDTSDALTQSGAAFMLASYRVEV